MKKNFIYLSLFLFSLLCCCETDDSARVDPIESLEDAQLIALSLNSLKTEVLQELESHSTQPQPGYYPVNLDVNAEFAGGATVVGTDTVWSVAGHSTGSWGNHTTVSFDLDGYSDVEFVELEKEGKLKYKSISSETTILCSPEPTCRYKSFTDTLQLTSPLLGVIISGNGKNIADSVKINVQYTRKYLEQGGVVKDSLSTKHFVVKTSSGLVFEW